MSLLMFPSEDVQQLAIVLRSESRANLLVYPKKGIQYGLTSTYTKPTEVTKL